jgi:signal transduction histidine kinase
VIFRTLRVPLALLAIATLGSVAIAGALVAYASIRTIQSGHLDRLLHTMAAGAFAVLEAGHGDGDGGIRGRIAAVVESPWKGTGVEFRIWSESAGTIASSVEEGERLHPSLDPPPAERPDAGSERYFDHAIGSKNRKTFRCLWARRGDVDVLLAHPSAFETRRLREAAVRLGLAAAGIAALAIGAALWGTRRALRSVHGAAAAIRLAPADGGAALRTATLPVELRPVLEAARQLHGELRDTIERREAFVGEVSHELRTPLSIAQSTLQLATSSTRAPEEYARAIESALEDLRAVERLIEAFAFLSKLGEGRAEPTAIRLDTLLRRLAEQYEDSGVECRPLPEVVVEGREELLERLFSNLVENAIAYGPSGGIVRIALAIGARTCTVSIEDRGGTVPQQDLERMFDRFYRGQASRERTGTGLGLAIARAIARHHGGEVSVEVVPGVSTRFVVDLPRT